MTNPTACSTCARYLADTKLPHDPKSEKPLAFDRHLDCCGRTICGLCQYTNPRFQSYCPFCQISSSPSSALPPNGLRLPPAYSKSDDKPERSLRSHLASSSADDAPPPYTPTSTIPTPTTRNTSPASPQQSNDTVTDTIHHLSSNDTIQSLSLLYNVPIPILQRHNNLYSANLLAARKTISIPATHYTGPPLSEPPDPALEEWKVMVRRWMVGTKCVEYKVAEVYLREARSRVRSGLVVADTDSGGVAAHEDASHRYSADNAHLTPEEVNSVSTQREAALSTEAERTVKEAVSRWKEDEEWERKNPLSQQKEKEKGKMRRVGGGGSLSGQLF